MSLGLGVVICFVTAVMFGVVGPDTASGPSAVGAADSSGSAGGGFDGESAAGDGSGSGGGPQTGSGGGAEPDGPAVVEPPPPGLVGLDPGLLQDALEHLRPSGAAAALVDPCLDGDTRACADLGEVLERECSAGNGSSCDLLYYATSAGSEQEAFGATCGGRFEDAAGECAALLG